MTDDEIRPDPEPMELREIVAVEAVARARSFKTAADILGTSQPTLSRLIASAEGKLTIRLFSRGWSGADTTSQGDVVVRTCRMVVTAIEKAQDHLFHDSPGIPQLKYNLRNAHLEAIEAVTRDGSVTRSARRLGRSQPDLSRTLSDFGKRFHLDLFRRTSAGMKPLAPARALAALSGSIRYYLDRLPEQLQRLEGDLVGRVSVGMLPFSGQDLILRSFAALTDRYPNIRLVCVPGSYAGLVEALRRREIDRIVGIMRGDACPDGITETHLYDERFTVIARRDHPLHQSGHDAAALAETNWIVAPHGTPVRSHFETIFSDMNVTPPTQTCELLSFGSAEQMLVHCHSVAMLTYSARKLQMLRPELAEVRTAFPVRFAPIGLSRLTDTPPDPAPEEFDRLFRDIVAAEA